MSISDILGGTSTDNLDTPDNIRSLNAALMSPSTSNMMMPQGIKQEVSANLFYFNLSWLFFDKVKFTLAVKGPFLVTRL